MKIQSDDSTPRRSALASTKADLREITGNSRATVQELQIFLRELRGKSPHEMLGVVASSYLVRALGISTLIVIGGILVFTAIPFFFGAKETPTAAVTAHPPPPSPPPAAAPEAPKAEPVPAPKTDPLAPIGVGEQLSAPPNKNPLENKGDDFLKDLE
jgi:hypothetical protein